MNEEATLAAEDIVLAGKGVVGAGLAAMKAGDSFLASLGGWRIKRTQKQRGYAAPVGF